MRKIIFTLLLLILATGLLAQIQFDIESFADSTKYGWKDWRARAVYRDGLLDRQEMLQLYEMESSSIGSAILKSALVPGFGQITSKAGTKGTIFLGAELLSLGVSLYLYDRSNYYYDQYLTATQIDEIQEYYSLAQTPRYYSLLFLALGVVIWGYNIYDVILTTDSYNAQVWQEILQKYAKRTVSLGPDGIRVRF
ncbi:MAG: hypothetical protein LHW45_10295 [Candidatus Cloacimonetes bacterium]|jgi:hypothetical protein|nr:hypothetical protein [Candidatus Cloacimonadota bacterium]MDD3142639.1 hypothetical protein [Candidatus Cloacimonadota bacterium]MDY0367999.1 hypothetical protein [Candidatus Syntrophosphaera sp.]HOY83815.1 hypothetical protein [Candidatus Syntrophosphaera sp.]HPH60017.1 hypothetical protein [Candidatus Syntrophosphaera sp.]